MPNTRETIEQTIREVLGDRTGPPGRLSDEQALFADGLGLTSLDFATLVVRLEQEIGYDPFRSGEQVRMPRCVGELIAIYDRKGD